MIALLAGIAGIISNVLNPDLRQSGATFLVNLAIFAIPAVVAAIALTEIHRLAIIGFLQGMWWQAVPSLVASIVLTLVAHQSGGTVRGLATVLLSFTGYTLGVIAAILLMRCWSPAADKRRAPRIRGLPVLLLGAVGLSQIAALVFYVTLGRVIGSYYSLSLYILGSAGVLVGLAVTWYAICLRARTLGGALLLGWVTAAALMLTSYMTLPLTDVLLFWSVLGFVLLARSSCSPSSTYAGVRSGWFCEVAIKPRFPSLRHASSHVHHHPRPARRDERCTCRTPLSRRSARVRGCRWLRLIKR